MGCSACAKKRAKPGESVHKPLVLGEPDADAGTTEVFRVRVNEAEVVAGAGVGAIRYVTGPGVEPMVEAEQLQVLSSTTDDRPRRISGVGASLWCIGEGADQVCYATRTQALRAGRRRGLELTKRGSQA